MKLPVAGVALSAAAAAALAGSGVAAFSPAPPPLSSDARSPCTPPTLTLALSVASQFSPSFKVCAQHEDSRLDDAIEELLKMEGHQVGGGQLVNYDGFGLM